MQVNHELFIFFLKAIAEKKAGAINVDTLITNLSAFQSGIELVENTKKIKTYKVGNIAFRLYCTECGEVEKINLFEKEGDKIYFCDFGENIYKQTFYYPDCLN